MLTINKNRYGIIDGAVQGCQTAALPALSWDNASRLSRFVEGRPTLCSDGPFRRAFWSASLRCRAFWSASLRCAYRDMHGANRPTGWRQTTTAHARTWHTAT
jgi:hypothetical protein